jgi:peptide chain release factor subunit 3
MAEAPKLSLKERMALKNKEGKKTEDFFLPEPLPVAEVQAFTPVQVE